MAKRAGGMAQVVECLPSKPNYDYSILIEPKAHLAMEFYGKFCVVEFLV
jgi:hypothetical protein